MSAIGTDLRPGPLPRSSDATPGGSSSRPATISRWRSPEPPTRPRPSTALHVGATVPRTPRCEARSAYHLLASGPHPGDGSRGHVRAGRDRPCPLVVRIAGRCPALFVQPVDPRGASSALAGRRPGPSRHHRRPRSDPSTWLSPKPGTAVRVRSRRPTRSAPRRPWPSTHPLRGPGAHQQCARRGRRPPSAQTACMQGGSAQFTAAAAGPARAACRATIPVPAGRSSTSSTWRRKRRSGAGRSTAPLEHGPELQHVDELQPRSSPLRGQPSPHPLDAPGCRSTRRSPKPSHHAAKDGKGPVAPAAGWMAPAFFADRHDPWAARRSRRPMTTSWDLAMTIRPGERNSFSLFVAPRVAFYQGALDHARPRRSLMTRRRRVCSTPTPAPWRWRWRSSPVLGRRRSAGCRPALGSGERLRGRPAPAGRRPSAR